MKRQLFFFAMAVSFWTMPLFSGQGLRDVPSGGLTMQIIFDGDPKKSTYTISAEIPAGFTALQPICEFGRKPGELIEFIPRGEDPFGWSEIITMNNHIGQKLSAQQICDFLAKKLVEKIPNTTIWTEAVSKEGVHQKALVGITYDFEGHHEILLAVFYSSPKNAMGVQYTIRPKEGETDEMVKAKLNRYFQESVKILEFDSRKKK
jgi:hypothetical protein